MALPFRTTGSLEPTFLSARLVSLAVKLSYALALNSWFPISLREPLRASVTLWEATAPVKLPASHCLGPGSRVAVRTSGTSGWYFKVDSTGASAPVSKSPTYPTQIFPKLSGKV